MWKKWISVICMIVALASPAWAARTVAIDPGHQGSWVDMSEPEPVAPGSSEMKAKASTGTVGKFTGVPEYQLALDVSLKLRDELKKRGYEVIMTREDNDTAISNAERATMASEEGGDIYLRIHANGVDDPGTSGAVAMTMSPDNPYVGYLYEESYALAQTVLNSYCAETGFANLGIQYYDNMTGINWSKIPVMILERGFMTNEGDDRAMQEPAMQEKMVRGIADGVDAYFAAHGEPEDETDTSDVSKEGAAGEQKKVEAEAVTEKTKSADGWQDIGVDAMQDTKLESAGKAEEAKTQEIPELAGRLYEQFLLTREMVGEKWAVGYMQLNDEPEEALSELMEEDLPAKEESDSSKENGDTPENETAKEPADSLIEEPGTDGDTDALVMEKDEDGLVEDKFTGTDEAWMINGSDVLQSASVIKLFIMGAVYDRICYPESDKTKIPYTENYEGELRSLLESMITVSSNEAANALIDILGQGDTAAGKAVVDAFAKEHGYKGVHLGRKFLESNPTDDNYITVDACVKFLSDVYYGRLVNKEASGKMLDILKGQTVKRKIPAGLPASYKSANKTGEMPEGYGLGCIENDTAIIWPDKGTPYILVILSNDLGGRNDEASEQIRQMSAFMASEQGSGS